MPEVVPPVGHGSRLRDALSQRSIVPFIGIYDAFSASLAGRRYDAIFLSGFGFAASRYGLPDAGFVTWSDVLAFTQRLRSLLPTHHLLVDVDDGYGDAEVAGHVVSLLEAAGASGIVLEDQRRPRRCGHLDGKQLLDLDDYLEKLRRVLAARRDLFVVARTDAGDADEIRRRVEAFDAAGADAILVDGVCDPSLIGDLSRRASRSFAFNQIAGGRSPALTLTELRRMGVSLVIYSTPCLFAAQRAIEESLDGMQARDGRLEPAGGGAVGVAECTAVLDRNLFRRR